MTVKELMAGIGDVLVRVIEVQCRVARIETRLMRLADELEVNVKDKREELKCTRK